MIKDTIKKMAYDAAGNLLKKNDSIKTYLPLSYKPNNLIPEADELWVKFIHGNIRENPGDGSRFFSFLLNLRGVIENNIEGDFAEVGVYKGNTAAILNYYAKKDGRNLYLFDTFEGFDKRDLVGVDSNTAMGFADTSLEGVKEFVGDEKHITYIKGYFPESVIDECKNKKYAFVHLDADLYQPTLDGLKFFYPLLSPGGIVFIHDYSSGSWEGCKKAVDDFAKETPINKIMLPDRSGTVIVTKPYV